MKYYNINVINVKDTLAYRNTTTQLTLFTDRCGKDQTPNTTVVTVVCGDGVWNSNWPDTHLVIIRWETYPKVVFEMKFSHSTRDRLSFAPQLQNTLWSTKWLMNLTLLCFSYEGYITCCGLLGPKDLPGNVCVLMPVHLQMTTRDQFDPTPECHTLNVFFRALLSVA